MRPPCAPDVRPEKSHLPNPIPTRARCHGCRESLREERNALLTAHELELRRLKNSHKSDLERVQDRVREVLAKKTAQTESLRAEITELRCTLMLSARDRHTTYDPTFLVTFIL